MPLVLQVPAECAAAALVLSCMAQLQLTGETEPHVLLWGMLFQRRSGGPCC